VDRDTFYKANFFQIQLVLEDVTLYAGVLCNFLGSVRPFLNKDLFYSTYAAAGSDGWRLSERTPSSYIKVLGPSSVSNYTTLLMDVFFALLHDDSGLSSREAMRGLLVFGDVVNLL
jgi:hypothetical protein